MDDRTESLKDEVGVARERMEDAPDPRTHEIRAEIEQTRDDMSETLDAIQEKLRPGHLVSEATGRVLNATTEKVKQMAYSASDTAGRVTDAGRQNWIPAALIGVGTAWLLMNRSDSRSSEYDDDSVYGVTDYRSTGRSYGAVGTRGYDVSGSDASNTFEEAKESVSGLAGRVGDRASEIADQTRSTVRRSTRRAQNQLQRLVYDNPLMVAAAAVMVGAAIGLAIPETARENEWMGEARENMIDKAQDAARGAIDKAKDVASKTVGDAITGNTKD